MLRTKITLATTSRHVVCSTSLYQAVLLLFCLRRLLFVHIMSTHQMRTPHRRKRLGCIETVPSVLAEPAAALLRLVFVCFILFFVRRMVRRVRTADSSSINSIIVS